MIPVSLLLVHFVGDFLLQSNWMAINKSKKLEALTIHCLIYAACFFYWGWQFALLTFWLHFITDFFTSRLTTKLWFIELEKPTSELRYSLYDDEFIAKVGTTRHWFFVAIGFDQLLHALSLGLTWHMLFDG